MPPLPSDLRKLLERAIVEARKVAEAGADQALNALSVPFKEWHDAMDASQKALRNRLRAHGRQLGDTLDRQTYIQTTVRLRREVAYEHWHRMLFARFLAENGLLIEPDSGASITLAECEDLARELRSDPFALAASFAERMLPQIFRADDPSLALALPPESRQALQRLLAGLPAAVFTAEDSLGWTYQFWQTAEKEAVNARAKSGEKITGETLPAVTQLFTEPYMVAFLLHNTLGAWHAGKVLAARPELAASAASEQELRQAVALDGYEFDYLRFVRTPLEGDADGAPTGPWRPASGVFETWPKRAAELKVLDPCCGSGHFLVAAFDLLTRLRMAEEGLPLAEAMRAVLADNLHGLELDARCAQIAAFNVALAAWRCVGEPIALPGLNVACSGMAPRATKGEWIELAERAAAAGGMPGDRDLFGKDESLLSSQTRFALEAMYDTFAQAPELGSLIDPAEASNALVLGRYSDLRPLLTAMLRSESDAELRERAVAAEGMAKAAELLVGPPGGYTLLITNVPYLGRKSHTDELKRWIDTHYKFSKNDLATVFVSRMLRWVGETGTIAAVTPENWLFLSSYRSLRQRLLRENSWRVVGKLGEEAWWSFGIRGPRTILWIINAARPAENNEVFGIDVSTNRGEMTIALEDKAELLRGLSVSNCITMAYEGNSTQIQSDRKGWMADQDVGYFDTFIRVHCIAQAHLLAAVDSVVSIAPASNTSPLNQCAKSVEGLSTGDADRYLMQHFEITHIKDDWVLFQCAPDSDNEYSGRSVVLYWQNGAGELSRSSGARVQGHAAWGRQGVIIGQMGVIRRSIYSGNIHDKITGAVVPNTTTDIAATWAFCKSVDYVNAIRVKNTKLSVSTGSLASVPFDRLRWKQEAESQFPLGVPEPQSNDPTQWLFHGHPIGMLAAGQSTRSPIGVADPVESDRHPSLICREPNMRDVLQVAIARLVGYRWPAEIDESMRLDIGARAWVTKCRELDAFVDEDGIVGIGAVRGEASAADRIRELLTAAFVDVPGGFTAARERELIVAAADGGQPAESLDAWLREQFFEQHCKVFHQRPFVWHIWDGRADGFNVLVNYHRLAAPSGEGRRTLSALMDSYLGNWIERQNSEVAEKIDGADGRLAAAMRLQNELQKILAGEPPYDIFVRWKPLHEQPLGWEPDINDGVRLNIRPFMQEQKFAGKKLVVLRSKPGIKWDKGAKDRGKEPQSIRPREQFPWFYGCDPEGRMEHRVDFGVEGGAPTADFDGARWNALHYSRKAKEAARARAASETPRV